MREREREHGFFSVAMSGRIYILSWAFFPRVLESPREITWGVKLFSFTRRLIDRALFCVGIPESLYPQQAGSDSNFFSQQFFFATFSFFSPKLARHDLNRVTFSLPESRQTIHNCDASHELLSESGVPKTNQKQIGRRGTFFINKMQRWTALLDGYSFHRRRDADASPATSLTAKAPSPPSQGLELSNCYQQRKIQKYLFKINLRNPFPTERCHPNFHYDQLGAVSARALVSGCFKLWRIIKYGASPRPDVQGWYLKCP